MKTTRGIIRYAALLGATAFLAACPPNAILSGLQDKVNAGQSGGSQTVSTPVLAPSSGTYQLDQLVILTDSTPGAAIYYTSATGGLTPPDPTSASLVFSAPIMVSGNGTTMTIKAIATSAGMVNSSVAIGVYTIDNSQASTPQFSLAAGAYATAQLLSITDSTAGANIAYTTDGSIPTESGGTITHGTLYTVSLNVSTTEMVKALAYKTGLSDSTLVTSTYTLPDAAPSFSPSAGTYTSPPSVTISTTMLGASIRYSTDGSTPTRTVGTVYATPVTVGVTETLKAVAYASGWADSGTAGAAYTITGTVAAPSMTPGGGTYTSARNVTLSTTTPGASIRYTTDGSTPTSTTGTLYSAPINVSVSETVKAIAYETAWLDSAVGTAAYTITGTVAAPTMAPGAGTYTSAQNVTVSTTTPGASIRYTLDGSVPSDTYGTVYTVPISIIASQTIKAIAYKAAWANSLVTVAAYVINYPTYTVAYNINGGHGGSVPTDPNAYHQGDTVIVLAPTGNLKKGPKNFGHWNTQANDLGTAYNPGDTFTMGTVSVTLYAIYP